MNLAPSFDYAFYKTENGLTESDPEAYAHFLREGKAKGLKGSPACDQGYFVRMILHMKPEAVLEIGPGSSPKLKGGNVYYFDVKTADELRSRYRADGSEEGVPVIHYVEPNGDLGIVDHKFDAVFSSHVIEHTTDLIKHLAQIESMLTERGHYFLVVPNKKFTFDFFKPTTGVEDVVTTHLDPHGEEGHFLRCFLLEELRRAHNDPVRHWAGDHGDPVGLQGRRVGQLRGKYEGVRCRPVVRSGYHRWVFDEDSFVELVNALYNLGLSPLRVRACYNTVRNSLSFNAVLSR
ncbi:class I SAM-dependent methyltransferase [Microvirga arabica]|uniref:Class I SAM-dependent methyltransferase n=1 Tax=Microvirga arabica TaxID=1128671 RepID=A0ABV6Y2X9_9HYPH